MEKNYLLSFTNNKKLFPIEKIDKDCLQYKELLFDSNQIFDKTNKSILGNSFLINNKPTNRNTKLWRQNLNENSVISVLRVELGRFEISLESKM